jgi:hypothetical protein
VDQKGLTHRSVGLIQNVTVQEHSAEQQFLEESISEDLFSEIMDIQIDENDDNNTENFQTKIPLILK